MTVAQSLTAAGANLLRIAVVLLLAGGWLVGVAGVSDAAIIRAEFESPGAGERISGPVLVDAVVDYTPPGRPDRVETRFTRGGQVAGNPFALSASGESENAQSRRARFSASFDPLQSFWFGGGVVPNGRYVLQMRVRESYGDSQERWTDWGSSRELVVDAPPPPTEASAAVQDPAQRAVEVMWAAVGSRVPDFIRYTVERAQDDGSFSEIHRTLDPAEDRFVDIVPADGRFRYRVTVHRNGAGGGERTSAAETAGVDVRQEAEPGPDRTTDPDGSQPSEEPAAGGAGDDRARPGSSGSLVPSTRPGTLARPTRPGGEQAPSNAPPGVGPSGVFEETLDYGEIPEGERTVVERRLVAGEPGGPREGGVLDVMNRELEPEQILVPIAAGLVFMMTALHVRRFLNP